MKKTFLVTYEYNYGNPKTSKVKAETVIEAAHIIESRRFGNYVLDVKQISR